MSTQNYTPPQGILHSIVGYSHHGELLICPFCEADESYVHIDNVSMINYQGMSSRGMHVITVGCGMKTDHRAGEGFPEEEWPRRTDGHTVRLHIRCEFCDGGHVDLNQHKGNTFVTKTGLFE